MPPLADLYTFPDGCNTVKVVNEAKKLLIATRIQEAIEQALNDCGYALLQAIVSEAVEALLKRNETLAGKMVIAEVMALIPLVRRYVKWRLASGHIKSSKALDELLDALTDKKLAAFFAAKIGRAHV